MKRALFVVVLITVVLLPFGSSKIAQAEPQTHPYLSPLPDSKYNPEGTTIAVRYGDTFSETSLNRWLFTVTGSVSGKHDGKIILANDQKTVIFKPEQPFAPGEDVTVRIRPGTTATEIRYSFSINRSAHVVDLSTALADEIKLAEHTPQTAHSTASTAAASPYKTAPADLPNITVSTPASEVGEGYLFVSNFLVGAFGRQPNPGAYLLILDNAGEPVYYQPVPETAYSADFKVLSNGLLAYWQDGKIYLRDSAYNLVRTISVGNGYNAIDVHDIVVLPNGNYMYLIYAGSTMDMTTHGGPEDTFVIDIVIQEQDANENIVFQWVGLDPGHYELIDSNRDLTASRVDYAHSNAVALDDDGNLLLSTRHQDEITKIDHETGDIIWRLGGKKNQFTISSADGITDDPTFYMQHDIRNLPDGANGDISLYDNHNNAVSGDTMGSRAMVFTLDETAMTAELVWQYRNTPDVYANFMGNAQYLPNGNYFIGWGGVSSPVITEVKQDGTKVFELRFDAGPLTYRGYRFPWKGYPTWAPALVIETAGENTQLYMSWNGATEIAKYEIYGWNYGTPTALLAEATKNSFETSVDMSGDQADFCFYQIMPVDNEGQQTQWSNVVQNPTCNLAYMPFVAVSAP